MRRKDTTSEMMKSYIIESLLYLLQYKSFQNISIGEIAAKAGVNRSTYYRHFNSKEDIIVCFYDNLMSDFEEQYSNCKNMKIYIENIFLYFSSYKKPLLLLYRNELSFLLLKVLNKYFSNILTPKSNVDEQYHFAYHLGGVFNSFLFWFSRDMEDSPLVLAKSTLKILSSGFKPFLLRD